MFLDLLATAIVSVIAVELFLALGVLQPVSQIAGASRKALRVMTAGAISDHWKEKVMLAYAGQTFAGVGGFVLRLCAMLVPVFGIAWLLGASGFLMTGLGLLASCAMACAWGWWRSRAATDDYSATDKLLHRLALGARPVAEMSFDIDQQMAKPADAREGQHVFVTGLARAGTTALMRAIHDSGDFRSLTYADMPFVLAPNLWAKLRGKIDTTKRERAHGDGVMVGADSPESLDEVFWRIFDGESYIKPDRLLSHAPSSELQARFQSYVGAILAHSGKARYLSKNNNNILRLPAVAAMFPNAVILVPFRDPVDQARSLLKQHQRFCRQHVSDGFSRDYMGWLVHHEFGSDHRPFAPENGGDPETLEYWLAQWTAVYGRLLDEAPENAVFVCYEQLCDDGSVWQTLSQRLGIADNRVETGFSRRPTTVDASRAPQAYDIYEKMLAHQSNALAST